jgi:hypothetical protein
MRQVSVEGKDVHIYLRLGFITSSYRIVVIKGS